jgi:hypothetical protein
MSKPTSILAKPLKAIMFAFVSLFYRVPVLAHDGPHDPWVICTKECTATKDPCGDGKAQSPKCASTDFITMISNFGYTNATELPNSGFVGCSQSVCNEACKNMNMTVSMEVVTDDQGGKVFCFPTPENMIGCL